MSGQEGKPPSTLLLLIGVATANEMRFCMMTLDCDHPDGVCVDSFSFRR